MEAPTNVMSWEMYAPGTILAFSAVADARGIRMMLDRDYAPVISHAAPDTTALLRVSQELRAHLRQLGYSATPVNGRMASGGGPCWGPAAPLPSSLIDVLRATDGLAPAC